MLHVFIYGCETWTLNCRGMNLVISCYVKLWHISGVIMLKQQLLNETDLRLITCIICECQLHLYGQVHTTQKLTMLTGLLL